MPLQDYVYSNLIVQWKSTMVFVIPKVFLSEHSVEEVESLFWLMMNLSYNSLGAGSSALKRPFEDGLGDDKDPNKKMKRNLRKSMYNLYSYRC